GYVFYSGISGMNTIKASVGNMLNRLMSHAMQQMRIAKEHRIEVLPTVF
ncbi:hypothetical protein LCGC14_3120110, partial [marine sediment metagenome]